MIEPWSQATLQQPAYSRFQAVVVQTPQQIAFIDEQGKTFSYQQLAQRVAFLVRLLGEGAQPVALYLPYNSDLLCAMLACLALGRPYVSLDPDFPIERNLAIIKQAGVAKVLIDSGAVQSKAISVVAPIVSVVAGLSEQTIEVKANANSIAYILYTSGTTGKPKGVFQNQRGLLHDVMQYSEAINITSTDCFSGLYSASVNGAIRDIFATLFNGATLVRINPKTAGLSGIAQAVSQKRITVFHAIPPLLRSFLNSQPAEALLQSIRVCYIAGDRLFASDLASLFTMMPPQVEVYNGIGSTECATLYRHWKISRDTPLCANVVPVGYPIADRETRLHYRDDGIAEVEVLSPYLAQGYWQDAELTTNAFKDVKGRPGWRSYLTGDLVRVVDNDLYSFVGRADNKQKIRGHLVDLSLLEAEFRSFAGITDVALLTDDEPQQPRLIAVLVGDAACENQLKTHLASQFSATIMPHHIVWLASLPRLPNFKLDQKTLKALVSSQLNISDFSQDNTEQNSKLAILQGKAVYLPVLELWLQVLKQPPLALLGNSFSALGGDSLDWLNFIAQLDLMLDKPFPVEHFSVELTFQQVIDVLHRCDRKLQHSGQAKVTLVVVPPFVGFGWANNFAEKIHPDIRLIMVPTSAIYNLIGETQPELQVVVDKLCHYIKSHVGDGIIHFYGVSSGAKPTFLAASNLQAQGMLTGAIIIGDCAPVGRAEHFASERLQAYSWLTSVIPYYQGTVVEVIATQSQDDQLKPAFVYGWWRYCSHVCYLPVVASHVACLTAAAVIETINGIEQINQHNCLLNSQIEANNLLKMANSALVSGNNLQAICYYEHLFTEHKRLKKTYGFNLGLARLRLQPIPRLE